MSFSKNSYRKYCLPSKIMPSLVTLIRFDGFKVRAHPDSKYFHGACKMQASVADFFAHALSHRRTVLHTLHMYTSVHRIANFLSRQIRWTCLDLIYFFDFHQEFYQVFTVCLDGNKELFKTICQNVCKIKISIFAL